MKKISNKNKWIVSLYIDAILIGQYVGALIVFPILIKEIFLVIAFIAMVNVGLFAIMNDLRLDTTTNKIFEKENE